MNCIFEIEHYGLEQFTCEELEKNIGQKIASIIIKMEKSIT
jgi:hypothetical protein